VLQKGFEIEIYTGNPEGEIIGLSDRIVAALPHFMIEPDNRNVEYVTPPRRDYRQLLCDLVLPRRELRRYLKTQGDYTLIPGSTLSLGGADEFHRSDPTHPYHDFIERTYGTRVVTASVHINVGIDNIEDLLRACRLIRLEAPLYLALSAASPFVNGEVTGSHSSRWQVFPATPAHVPLFANHQHHIDWVTEQIALGTMQNVRHLWSSVRPNGDDRPHNLNRLELRICDLVTDPNSLLAITALLEARIHQLLADPSLDPLTQSDLSEAELLALTHDNEQAAARSSLDSTLRHWQDGRSIVARDWIAQLRDELMPIAEAEGFGETLVPLERILRDGNTAQQWLRLIDQGWTPTEVLQGAIVAIEQQERELECKLCQPVCS
jgi:predicted glutamate--cysteine ligase